MELGLGFHSRAHTLTCSHPRTTPVGGERVGWSALTNSTDQHSSNRSLIFN